MHLVFVDIAYGYTADRPDQDKPIGGTTSAVCWLARELTKAGIRCTFYNLIDRPGEAYGIPTFTIDDLGTACTDISITAFIFCGRWIEGIVDLIHANSKAKLIAWMHESTFNSKLVPALHAFDGVAYVSEWQQRINQSHAKPHWQQVVISSGMNPHFLDLFEPDEPIIPSKTHPPILLYAGTFPRGAFHMPPLLDKLRKRRCDFTVEMFCNTNPSGDKTSDDTYITWLRGLPNITHVGQIEQRDYPERLKRCAFLIAPNPWPETLCMAMIEAMAAGLSVIASDRAVLPETASGFARHIAVEDADHPLRFDMPMPYDKFAEAIDDAMTEWLEQPAVTEKKLRAQVDYYLQHFRWADRPQMWVDYIQSVAGG